MHPILAIFARRHCNVGPSAAPSCARMLRSRLARTCIASCLCACCCCCRLASSLLAFLIDDEEKPFFEIHVSHLRFPWIPLPVLTLASLQTRRHVFCAQRPEAARAPPSSAGHLAHTPPVRRAPDPLHPGLMPLLHFVCCFHDSHNHVIAFSVFVYLLLSFPGLCCQAELLTLLHCR